MRLGIIAAAEASPSASDPNVGERDATLMRERLVLEDMGFVVHTLDPSVDMAEQFKKHGVEHKLISIPGGEHGLGGGDPKLIDAAYVSALAFVNRHMKE